MARVASLFCILSLSVLASCSSFDNRWDSTAAPVAANPAAPVAGKWEGTWQSDNTSHWGHMQALITPTTVTVQDKVQVQQYATSIRIRFFELGVDEYTLTLNATKLPDGRIHFEGTKDLGYFKGGIIRYDGYLISDTDTFFCDYSSDTDYGTFKMRRITMDTQ